MATQAPPSGELSSHTGRRRAPHVIPSWEVEADPASLAGSLQLLALLGVDQQ